MGVLRVTVAGPERVDDVAPSPAGTEHFIVAADACRAGDDDVRSLVAREERAGVVVRVIDGASELPMLPVRLPLAGDHPEAAALLRAAEPLDQLVLPEPLSASAPLARHAAAAMCDGCADYHGLVQTLRLLGVVASPQRHGGFYRSELGAVASRGGTRVLIAGAADYGMLAHVLAAFADAGAVARVRVVDRCPTPLALCRWYAAAAGVAIDTEVGDLVRRPPDGSLDVVVSDSVLTLLDPAGRAEVLRRWGGALTAEGRIVTTLRLQPAGRFEVPDASAIDAFVDWVIAEARLREALLGLDLDDLEARVRRYADAPVRSWPVSDAAELEALAAGAGLAAERLDVVEIRGRGAREGAGPGAHRDATYARVVLRRA